jgi:hypothetical protein
MASKIKLPPSPADRQRARKLSNDSLSFNDLTKQLTSIVTDLNNTLSSNSIIDTSDSKMYTSDEVNNLINIALYDKTVTISNFDIIETKYKNIILSLENKINDLNKELSIKEGVIDVLKHMEIKTSYTQDGYSPGRPISNSSYERPKIGGQIVIDPTPKTKLESHINIKETDITKDDTFNKEVINDKVSKLKKLLG